MGMLRQARGWLVINRGEEADLSEVDQSASDEREFEDC